MISTDDASRIVMEQRLPLKTVDISLEEATSHILQEPLLADRDFPPFDRVTMDGIAYAFANLQEGGTLVVEDLQLAGEPQKTLQDTSHCLEVMTGAMLPNNTDTVSRYEDVEIWEEDGQKRARLLVMPEKQGQNIHTQGLDQRVGDLLLEPGVVLNPAAIAVAASIGKTQLQVSRLPGFGIISTGDELVEVGQLPQPYQIRRSNGYALQAALSGMGFPAVQYHFEDTRDAIRKGLQKALSQHDVLILSGGVSKGKKDYVPETLEELGVQKLFHQVKQRPGKPFWFGVNEEGKVVFALPGNPVSTFMCFHRYVKPWLDASMGKKDDRPVYAVLTEDVSFEPALTYFLQVEAHTDAKGVFRAHPYLGHGSGDFANLLRCNGFLELPPEKNTFRKGDAYPFIPF